MRKILRLTAIILVLGSILFIRPMQAMALDPGDYPVTFGTVCNTLASNPDFAGLRFNYGYKVENTATGTYPFDESLGGLKTGLGQLDDPANSVTLSGGGDTINWAASLGIDAVIVHGTNTAYAYYYSPESGGGNGLKVGNTGEAISSIEVCFDYELQATSTANTVWYKFINWSISKTANAASAAAFAGAAPSLTYTIDLTKAEILGPYKLSGVVTVTNPSPLNVPSFTVVDTAGGNTMTITCAKNVLSAYESTTCDYAGDLADNSPGTNVATVTSSTALVGGTTTSKNYSFGGATLLEGSDPETVVVSDSLAGSLGTFSTTSSKSYAATTVCSPDPASYTDGHYSLVMNNTATIDKTAPESDNLSIPLDCYAPQVTKTATATAYKTVDWTIGKSVAQASQNKLAGESATFNYTVSLDKQVTDGPFVVDGTITVANPAGAPGNMPISVSDALGGGTAVVDCDPNTAGNQNALSVPAGQSRACTYSASLTAATNGTNTATVSLNGTSFRAEAGYTFGAAVLNPNSEPDSVTVNDSFAGVLGPYSQSINIPYSRTETCSSTPSAYTAGHAVVNLNNTARINGTTDPAVNAPATLNCYAPVVSKTADARYTELHNWTLSKVADPALQNALAGQTARYTWQILVNETVTEQEYTVDGTIQVSNPAPLPMRVNLSDTLIDTTPAVISACTNGTYTAGTLNIAANTTASCTYSAAPTGRNATTNIATATLNGIAFTASADLNWTADALNASVTLDDDQNPNFPLTISQGGSYSYADSYLCATTPSSYTGGKYTFGESNTVTLKTDGVTLASFTADAAVDCFAPTMSKTASASYTELHTWTLAKNGSPETQSVFAGQTASYTWAIEVTEQVSEEAFSVTGQISVVNPAPVAMTVSLSDVLSDTTPASIGPCSNGTLANGSLTIPATTTAVCDYTAAPAGRTATVNTASLNLNGFSLSSTAPITWVATLVNPSVTLNDDQNPNLPQTLTGTTSISYKKTHVCPVDQVAYINGLAAFSESNTATLMSGETLLDTKTASVQVDCFAPIVSKTANAVYTAEHTWTLDKTVTPGSQKIFAGQSAAPFTWTVTVGHQVAETGFLVTGKITITNPSGEAMQVGLADAVGDSTQATIIQSPGCNIANGQLTIRSNGTAVCDYTASPPDRTATTNTAVVTLNGVEFTGGHALDWAPTATNAAVTLDDERNPDFPLELTEGGVFTYVETPACPVAQTVYVDGHINFAALNTATLSAGGTVLAQDSATFNVDCYAPIVSKTAAGTTYKGINWFITKTADQPTAAGLAGGTATLGYTLTLDKQINSLLHLVEGEITISSPADAPAAMDLTVTDLVVPTGLNTVSAAVDCDQAIDGNQATLSLAPGAVHVCTYTASLDTPTGGTNTAFVNLPPQPDGQGVYVSATVDYIFGTTDLSKSEPETITVHDSMAGNLGLFSESATVPYTAEAACPTDPSAYVGGVVSVTVANTAKINETPNDESSASVQLSCYAPTVSKTAVATAYKSINWSIAKSAKQAELAAFAGQSVTFDYTVTLTKDETSGLNVVEGVITVSSPTNAPADMALTLTDLVQPTSLAPVAAAVDCNPAVGGNQPALTLAAGASAECTYYAELPSATNGLNKVTANLNGVPLTFEKDYTFGEQVEGVTEPGTITVTDDLVDQTWTFTQSGSQDYSYTATCPASQTAYPNGSFTQDITNTATINETQDAPVSATVTLNCYTLLVSKTASAVAYESIDWTLDKVSIQPPSGGFAGGVVNFDYQLTATRQVTPGPFLVSGAISLANPAEAPGAVTLNITDVTGGQPTFVDCDSIAAGNQPDVTLLPGGSASCSYTASLPAAVDGVNTATITMAGGGAFTVSAPYAFGAPVLADSSEPGTITVIDGFDSWTTDKTQTWNITAPQTCPADPAAYDGGYYTTKVNNTATIFETDDTDSVILDLECYAPLVSKTASAAAYTSVDWTLTKTANLASLSLFAGQSQDIAYTLELNRTEALGPNLVQGVITVTNPHPTQVLSVVVTDEAVSGAVAAVDCDPLAEGDQANLIIQPGETRTCTALAHLPAAVDGLNTASVILPPPYAGIPFTATASYTFGDPQPWPGSEPLEVSITDSLGGKFGPFTDGTTINYTKPATCPADPAVYVNGVVSAEVQNSAVIDQTQDAAQAVVPLECYAPVVSKTANASWTKTIDWTLAKTVAPLSVDLLAGETADFAYTLALAKQENAGAYTVSGVVTLANPAGAPAAIVLSVTDVLRPAGHPDLPVVLDCGVDQPDPANLLLQPGESAACTYSAVLDGAFDGVNTVSVTLLSPQIQGGFGGAGGAYTVSAPYAFGAAELTPGSEPETVMLIDTFDNQPQNLGSFSLGQEVPYTRTLACPVDPAVYVNGVYSYTRINTAKIVAANGGQPTGDEATQTVTVNCTLPGAPAQVIKVIDQGSQAIGEFPIQFALYPPEATEPVETVVLSEADVAGDGQYALPFQTLVTAGTWTVKELLPDGWKSAETTCTLVVPDVVTSGQVFTCTFTNTELSRLRLLKTTNGQIDPTRDWKLVLIPSPLRGEGAGGEVSSTLGDADGWLDFGEVALDPSQSYTVCELAIVKNWASVWSAGGVILPGYYLNGAHCVGIGAGTALPLQPGEALALHVNNISTLGAPGSSGYWKNSDELEELLSRYTFTIGTLQLGSANGSSAMRLASQASMAVLLLDQRDLGTGKKMSSDALYQLAAELFVYRLNQANGACVRPEAEALANSAQALLLSMSFNGRGAYVRHPDATLKAAALAKYNNGSGCGK